MVRCRICVTTLMFKTNNTKATPNDSSCDYFKNHVKNNDNDTENTTNILLLRFSIFYPYCLVFSCGLSNNCKSDIISNCFRVMCSNMEMISFEKLRVNLMGMRVKITLIEETSFENHFNLSFYYSLFFDMI